MTDPSSLVLSPPPQWQTRPPWMSCSSNRPVPTQAMLEIGSLSPPWQYTDWWNFLYHISNQFRNCLFLQGKYGWLPFSADFGQSRGLVPWDKKWKPTLWYYWHISYYIHKHKWLLPVMNYWHEVSLTSQLLLSFSLPTHWIFLIMLCGPVTVQSVLFLSGVYSIISLCAICAS